MGLKSSCMTWPLPTPPASNCTGLPSILWALSVSYNSYLRNYRCVLLPTLISFYLAPFTELAPPNCPGFSLNAIQGPL